MTSINQAVIIGAGHNGLVCAAYLAKAGKKVTVLEASGQVGGAAITREFAPDFKVSACAHLLYLLDAGIRKELALDGHGLAAADRALQTIALARDGNHLVLSGTEASGGGISADDQAALKEYHRFMGRFAGVIGKLHNRIPPRIASGRRNDLIGLGKVALDIRLLGRDDMREFLRIAGINIYDVLQENFDSDLLKGALALDAVLGTQLGPRSNNSVFTALHRMSGNGANGSGSGRGRVSLPSGGMGTVTEALAAAARRHGADIRTSTPVARILMDGARVSGVELENGEQILADAVISSADPKTTFLGLLGARNLEAGFAQKVHHLRARGTAAKVHLALSELPAFTGLVQEQMGQRLVIAPDLHYVEKAFNHSKYGEYSAHPVAEIVFPSVHDSGLAPAGQHVLSAVVQYAPRELKEGWGAAKAAFTETVLDLFEQYAPDIRSKVVATEVLTPEDIENEFRISGGHWHHAELSLDQFLMLRPVPHAAQYAAPVDGLWLCGAGSHPGGGVMGSAGRNAARAVLAQNQNGRTS